MITKKDRILVLDTETANTLTRPDGSADMSDVLVYDCGWQVTDREGSIYESASYVNKDIFCKEQDMMQSAYYADKIPRYKADLDAGTRKLASFYDIRMALLDAAARHDVKYFAAYNARFDANALNRTQSWITKSAYRYALPFGQIIWLDIMKMAQDAIVTTRAYKQWATDNDFLQKNGVPRKTAEMIYRYITGREDFEESHTGLEDVEIETFIMAHCFAEAARRKVKMRTLLWENPKEFPKSTDFQTALMASLKQTPTLNMGRY